MAQFGAIFWLAKSYSFFHSLTHSLTHSPSLFIQQWPSQKATLLHSGMLCACFIAKFFFYFKFSLLCPDWTTSYQPIRSPLPFPWQPWWIHHGPETPPQDWPRPLVTSSQEPRPNSTHHSLEFSLNLPTLKWTCKRNSKRLLLSSYLKFLYEVL